MAYKFRYEPILDHPTFLTTPAHQLVRKAGGNVAWRGGVSNLQNVEDFMLSPERNGCECQCSLQGCLCIGCAASKHDRSTALDLLDLSKSDVTQSPRKWKQIEQPYVLSIVYQHKDKSWMSSAVLRVLTFERLSLTHTCCYQVLLERRGRARRLTAEEADVIHEQERDRLELLDDLVAQFEAKWAAYDKPFVTFMNRVWKRRMRQIEMEGQADREMYLAGLLRMGVRLEETDESDSDWPDEYAGEDEREGWYTADEEEDENVTEEEARDDGI